MDQDMIIDGLAVIGAGTCLYWLVRALSFVLQKVQADRPDVAFAATPPADRTGGEDDIAVIAAAVYATLSSHRIVKIESAVSGVTWSAEGRWMHQTSHRPR